MKIHDLSVTVGIHTPSYPGDPIVGMEYVKTHANDSYCVTALKLGTHSGTHVDVPLHFIDGGATAETFPVETFVGQATVVAAPKQKGGLVTVADIESVDIGPGEILIVATGWEKHAGKPEYFEDFPAFEHDVADYLIAKKIKALGTDMPSMDNKPPAYVHQHLLKHGIGIIEALVNLQPLTGERFFFVGAPLKLRNCDGSPVRALGIQFDE